MNPSNFLHHRFLHRKLLAATLCAGVLLGAFHAPASAQIEQLYDAEFILYGIDRGFAIRNGKALSDNLGYIRWKVRYKKGEHNAHHMCQTKPNEFDEDGFFSGDKAFKQGELENGTLYTVMVRLYDKNFPNWWECAYYIGQVRPNAQGVLGVIAENLNPGSTVKVGPASALLKWNKPKGDVSGYRIYYRRGAIRKNSNHAALMCDQQRNEVHVDADATQHLIKGLANDQVYTFLVKTTFKSGGPGGGVNCAYVLHIANTPRAELPEIVVGGQ
ncbi:MAG: fibronectin type III domain-containing protein [bacterium]